MSGLSGPSFLISNLSSNFFFFSILTSQRFFLTETQHLITGGTPCDGLLYDHIGVF